jgi:hypothetical protein
MGWTVKPPSSSEESKESELFRLIIEQNAIGDRVKVLLTEGAKIKEEVDE